MFCINKLKISIEEFWKITPREAMLLLNDYVNDIELNQKKDAINMISTAWHIANFSNAKKLPSLNNVLKDILKDNKKNNAKSNKMSEEEIKKHYQSKVVR